MLGKCFAALVIISTVFAVLTGNVSALSGAILDGASKAVTLSFSLLGMMCLWSGIMSLLSSSGMIRTLSRMLRPILRHVFPHAAETGDAEEEIVAAVTANLFGLGNAATPLAITAMKRMREESGSDTATDDMVTLAVLGTASFNIFPSTLIALRRAADAADPFSVIVPIWITSGACCIFAVLVCRILPLLARRREGKAKGKDCVPREGVI